MSAWCVGCHSTYMTFESEEAAAGVGDGTTAAGGMVGMAWKYNAGDGAGLKVRHKHPINVPLSNYQGPDKASMIVTENVLPLAHDLQEGPTAANASSDWIDCLTCHRSHGTSASMIGFAADGSQILDTDGYAHNNFFASPSALLRRDNRGVCEVCHNK